MLLPRFAWATLAYNLAVIVFGAFVRASGSGAGCGSHWPLCNGTVVPRAPESETIIELTHRLTSGVALLLVVAMVWLARREWPAGHLVRKATWTSLFFMLTEAAVGAGLVLLELTAGNDSMLRAVYLGVHLVNTFLLVAAIALTAWWAGGRPPLVLRGRGDALLPLWGAALAGLLAIGVTGAVTALGDTLFPAGSLAEGLREDFSPTAHLLVRLRVIHPALAVLAGGAVLALAALAAARDSRPTVVALARATGALVMLQWVIGAVNLGLLAPVALQLVHLLVADLVWLGAVLLAAAQLAASVEPARTGAAAGAGAPAAFAGR